MATTPPPEDVCDECYMLGVLCALAGSSFQALGLSLWKLHHVRTEKAEEERLAGVRAREERILAYHNRRTASEAGSSQSQQKNKSRHSDEITEDSCAGSNAGDMKVSVGPKDGKALSDIDEEEEQEAPPAPKFSWIWTVGFIIFAIGNGGDFIALGITKQSVVTLVGSWALVVNTLTARCLLHEIVHPLDIFSSVLIICGIVLTVIFSGQDSPEWPLERIVDQYQKPPVVIMLIILASMIFVGLTIMHLDHVKRNRDAKASKSVPAKPSRAIGALYCVVGSLVADFTVLFGKAFSGLLLPTLAGDNQFTSPFVVLIVLVFCVSLPSQIYLIDQSLTVNDALYHIPNFYVFWNVGSIITGAIYYEEMANFGLANWLGFFSGVGVLFLGVYLTNIAAGKKQAILDAKERARTDEEWMGGGGNEDGLRPMYEDDQHYTHMWEQHAGPAAKHPPADEQRGEEGGEEAEAEAVTEIDERGEERVQGARPESSPDSLRDVTMLERGAGQSPVCRGQLRTPQRVDEADEQVMENLMRTLREATGDDHDTDKREEPAGGALPEEDLPSPPCALRAPSPQPRQPPALSPSPEHAARIPMDGVGGSEYGWAGAGGREEGTPSAAAEATLGGDASRAVAPRRLESEETRDEGEEDSRSARAAPVLEYMPAGGAGAGAERERELALWRRRSLRKNSEAKVPSLLDVSWGQDPDLAHSAKVPGRVSATDSGPGGVLSSGPSPPSGWRDVAVPPHDWREAHGSWLQQRRSDRATPATGTKYAATSPLRASVPPPSHNSNGGLSRAGSGSEEWPGSGGGSVERSPVSYLVKHFSGSGRMPKWYHEPSGLSPSPPATQARTPPGSQGPSTDPSLKRPSPTQLYPSSSLAGPPGGRSHGARTIADLKQRLAQRREEAGASDSRL